MVILLVLTFRSSSNLAGAYGIAVVGAMLIDSVLITVVLRQMWNWNRFVVAGLLTLFFATVDFRLSLGELAENSRRRLVPAAGRRDRLHPPHHLGEGSAADDRRMNEASLPMEIFIKSAAPSAARVPGTAVFMTSSASGVPHALLHNLKHNKVLHERVILLTVRIEDVPYVSRKSGSRPRIMAPASIRVVLRYGFMEEIDVPAALAQLKGIGPQCQMMDTSFFLRGRRCLPRRGRGWRSGARSCSPGCAQRGKRDGILQAADEPRGRARQPGRNLNLRPRLRIAAAWLTASPGSRRLRPSLPRR